MAYPVLDTSFVKFVRGPGWKKTPHYNTVTQKPAAGRGVVTASLVPYPTWDFEVHIEWARGDEKTPTSIIAAFMDVYMQCLGSGGFFLVADPNDNAITTGAGIMLNVTPGAGTPMGTTGDGVSTMFQLARTIGPSGLAQDIIQNVNGSPTSVNINGSPTVAYSISSTGVVTFTSAPTGTLSWGGNFYYLCQFTEDTLQDLARVGAIPNVVTPAVMDGLWSCGNIKFSSVFI
jgi:hypothetical protein